MNLSIIILAAGNSRRFHENKLLYPIEGRTMVEWTFSRTKEAIQEIQSCDVTVSVITQYEKVVELAKRYGFKVYKNPHPEEGISSSIRIGILSEPKADAYLFQVCDQPWLKKESLLLLMESYIASEKGIAGLTDSVELGNPCVFSKKYKEELLELTGDVGGKRILKRHKEDTLFVKIEDVKELIDVDTL